MSPITVSLLICEMQILRTDATNRVLRASNGSAHLFPINVPGTEVLPTSSTPASSQKGRGPPESTGGGRMGRILKKGSRYPQRGKQMTSGYTSTSEALSHPRSFKYLMDRWLPEAGSWWVKWVKIIKKYKFPIIK